VDLVGVGLNATDTLIPIPHFPASGSKIDFHHATVLPGGQVATAMVACAAWGLRARYIGRLGDDPAAELHLSAFRRAGVDARILPTPHCPSPQSFILVAPSGERTVLCQNDDRLTLRPDDLQRDWVTDARCLHVDGHDTEAACTAAAWARAADLPTVADLDEAYPGVERLLAHIDYLIVSRDIPSRLTGQPDLHQALRELLQRFGCRLAAATLGPEGVLAWDSQAFHYAPAFHVDVVDTTGAGDIFHAGFIYGLLQTWPLPRTLDFACVAAALNCTGHGARGGIHPISAIEHLIATGPRHPSWTGHRPITLIK
jgi:sugar/nucleoside kinase (ribokinase family)